MITLGSAPGQECCFKSDMFFLSIFFVVNAGLLHSRIECAQSTMWTRRVGHVIENDLITQHSQELLNVESKHLANFGYHSQQGK